MAMAVSLSFYFSSSSFSTIPRRKPTKTIPTTPHRMRISVAATDATKLVTFLGKGGSGKTTAAVLAAKYYASEGMRTCLVTHSQDPTAEHLMGCKIENSPTECGRHLSAMKLETSKMLLEPLDRLKKVDARINFTQGFLESIVGEELGVLPGMDSIFPVLALQKLVNFLSFEKNTSNGKFDMVVYDCSSSEDILRLIGSTDRLRSYLMYTREMAEKTDIGRLASPSLLKLAYESAITNGKSNEGRTSTEIWNEIEQLLQRVSVWFADPMNFACYMVMDPSRSISVTSALRYWGCAIQAGKQISGAFGYAHQPSMACQEVPAKFAPVPFALLPYLSTDSSVDWDKAVDSLSQDTKELLQNTCKFAYPLVTFDSTEKLVTLFMPGFDKSEIKLYQYRGGSELLIEAADQRRIVKLPPSMHGKVASAKFVDRNLVVKLQ